jgi:hypothetical protein
LSKAMVSFAFGTPASNRANSQIAEATEHDASSYGTRRIYTQPDIKIGHSGLFVEYIEEQDGHPSPTLRIARWAVQRALQNGDDELILEAAPDHQWRVLRDMLKAIKEAKADITAVLSNSTNLHYREDSWYRDSTQPRTHSHKAFMKRENILKKMPWWLYKLIAK